MDPTLTRREWQVILQLDKGKQNKQIAQQLGIFPGTVNRHRYHIKQKLGLVGGHFGVNSLWAIRRYLRERNYRRLGFIQ